MGDRRIADRREKEKGVIKIKFEDAVKYAIVGVILITAIITDFVLAAKLNRYKKIMETYLDNEEFIGEEIDVDALMNAINDIDENTVE